MYNTYVQVQVLNIQKVNKFWKAVSKVTIEKEVAEYEVWLEQDFFSNNTHDIKDLINNHAVLRIKEWINENDNKLPKQKAIVITQKGRFITDDPSIIFNQNLHKDGSYIRTNINLPAYLYDWSKNKSQEEGISLSELIRRGILAMISVKEGAEKLFYEKRVKVFQRLKELNYVPTIFEVNHYLPYYFEEFNQEKIIIAKGDAKERDPKSILEIAKKSTLPNTGWPIGVATDIATGKPLPIENGVEAEYSSKQFISLFDYWFLNKRAEFYFARTLEEDGFEEYEKNAVVWFDTRIWRIAEALEHCLNLYRNMRIPEDQLVKIKISLVGLNGRKLSAENISRRFSISERVTHINEVEWVKEIRLEELSRSYEEYVYEAAKKFFQMFDFFEPDHNTVLKIIEEYKKSKML